MPEQKPPPASQSRQRIEQARDDAAAYIVQQAPMEKMDTGEQEEEILEAMEQARTQADASELDELADEAEQARDEVRREAYGRDRPDAGR